MGAGEGVLSKDQEALHDAACGSCLERVQYRESDVR